MSGDRGVAGLCLAVGLACAPPPTAVAGLVAGPSRASDLLVTAAALLVWATALIVLLGAVLARLLQVTSPGSLPRRLGRAAPGRFALRVAGSVLGLGIATAATALAAEPRPGGLPVAAIDLDWPTGPALQERLPSRAPAPHLPPAAPPTAPPGAVTVRPGDCLWRIAAAHLRTATPARVAAEWPRWWQANRAVIGPDPDLLHPGAVLHAPPA